MKQHTKNGHIHMNEISICCSNYLPIKYIVNLFPYVRAQHQELSIYPVQRGLQEVAFSRVLRVEQVQ